MVEMNAYNATPITSATTTQVFTGTGTLAGFWVSSGTTPSVQVYDNTASSGTPILDTTVLAATGFYSFPGAFVNGLRVVTAGTNPKITVLWAQG